ncbi:MAG: AraC family transcriptional regulator [Verrucomicrobiales bacterium]
MKDAAHDLRTTPRRIDDIAAAVGFKDRHHFTRVFTLSRPGPGKDIGKTSF